MPWKEESEGETPTPGASETGPGNGKPKGGCLRASLAGGVFLLAVVTISWALISDYNASGAICTSSTASLAYLVIPFYAAIPALPFLGLALVVSVVLRARAAKEEIPRWVPRAAGVLALAWLAYLGAVALQHHRLTTRVAEVRAMDDAALAALLEAEGQSLDRHVLTAVALNPRARATTLHHAGGIAAPGVRDRDTTWVAEPLWDFALTGVLRVWPSWLRGLQGENQYWGLSVHELIALNPNTGPETLALLADSPNAHTVANVAMNPATPPSALQRIAKRMGERTEGLWLQQELCDRPERVGAANVIALRLAENPALPVALQESLLAGGTDACLASAIATNPGATPAAKAHACEILAGKRRCWQETAPPAWLDPRAGQRRSSAKDACPG